MDDEREPSTTRLYCWRLAAREDGMRRPGPRTVRLSLLLFFFFAPRRRRSRFELSPRPCGGDAWRMDLKGTKTEKKTGRTVIVPTPRVHRASIDFPIPNGEELEELVRALPLDSIRRRLRRPRIRMMVPQQQLGRGRTLIRPRRRQPQLSSRTSGGPAFSGAEASGGGLGLEE